MKDKGHFFVSFIKSAIRIYGAMLCFLTGDLMIFALCIVMAEFLGILEEVVDKR